jgi:ferredoxin--NADP+ reductase
MFEETSVLSTTHYTNRLFSFKTSRPGSFRFRSGEFTMLGLELPDDEIDGEATDAEKKPAGSKGTGKKRLMRAYSIASPSWDDELEFFSIKVPDGPLTSRLQNIAPGDKIILGKKPTGTLVMDALEPGRTLYLLSTGTGIAPFSSLVRDPEVYEKFDQVVLTHGCRTVAELQYGHHVVNSIREDETLAEMTANKLIHYTAVTREKHTVNGRLTALIESGELFRDVDQPPLSAEHDRVMICGSLDMTKDLKALCMERGLVEGSVSRPGTFVTERAFVG